MSPAPVASPAQPHWSLTITVLNQDPAREARRHTQTEAGHGTKPAAHLGLHDDLVDLEGDHPVGKERTVSWVGALGIATTLEVIDGDLVSAKAALTVLQIVHQADDGAEPRLGV